MAEANIVLKLIDKISNTLGIIRRAMNETGRSFDDMGGKVSNLDAKNSKLNSELGAVSRAMSETGRSMADIKGKIRDLEAKNAQLNEQYADQQVKVTAAKEAVKDAAKAYKDAATDANAANLKAAEENLKSLTDKLQDYRRSSAETRKEIHELINEQTKLGDIAQTAGISGGSSGDSGQTDTGASPLTGWGAASSGLAKQLGGALTGMGSSMLSSLLGSSDAEVVSSMLGGAAAGAATGLLAGPVGAAVGAVVGGVSGLLSGAAAQLEAEDDVFRSYRDDLISAAQDRMSTALSSGSNTAATREQDKIGFSALLGSEAEASSLLDSIKTLANATPYVYDDLVGIARQLAIYDSTSADLYDNLVRIGDAGSALGKTGSDMQGLAALLGKIGDTETYSSTFTKSLRNYGINPASFFAEYYGITTEEANAMLSDSKNPVSGSEALQVILSVLESRYSGMMEVQSHTYAGALSTRAGKEDEANVWMGRGYNDVRADGLNKHNDWLDDFAASDAYSIIGRANAQKDNLQDQFYRDVIGGIFRGDAATVVDEETQESIDKLRSEYLADLDEYADADEQRQMEIGADISRIYAEAESLATAAADASKAMDAWDKAAIETADGVGQIVGILNAHADSWAYSKATEKGLIASLAGVVAHYTETTGQFKSGQFSAGFHSAYGQRTIPFDNFPILAHQGEALLTAAEAREYRSGGGSGPTVTVTGNSFVVRQESDIDAIADALYRRFRQVAQIME